MMKRARLLPITITVMVLLFGVKSVSLMQAVMADRAPEPLVASAAAATPASVEKKADGAAASAPISVEPQQVAPSAPSGPPPVSDGERALLLQLRQRRTELDTRAAQIDAREAVLEAAEHKLDARLDELAALQTRLQGLEDGRKQHDEANWAGLVKLYETMKPRDAAVIFNDLDMAVLLPVVDRMKDSKAAAIFAAMDPGKARVLTTNLAQTRLRANSAGG